MSLTKLLLDLVVCDNSISAYAEYILRYDRSIMHELSDAIGLDETRGWHDATSDADGLKLRRYAQALARDYMNRTWSQQTAKRLARQSCGYPIAYLAEKIASFNAKPVPYIFCADCAEEVLAPPLKPLLLKVLKGGDPVSCDECGHEIGASIERE